MNYLDPLFHTHLLPTPKRTARKRLAVLAGAALLVALCQPADAVTIAVQDFEASPATPTATYTATGGGPQTGSSTDIDRPSLSPFYSSGVRGYQVTGGTATLTFDSFSTSGYSDIELTLRVAAFSYTTSANGLDASDYVEVQVSPDNGAHYYPTVRVKGYSNAYWGYASGTVNAFAAYDGDATAAQFSPTSGGSQTTGAPSTITITSLPAVSQLRVKIVMLNDSVYERWVIDDLEVTGTSSATPAVTLSDNGTIGTGNVLQGSTANVLLPFQLAVTTASATLNQVDIVTAGDYATADVNNLKLWYSASSTFSVGTATVLSTLTSPAGAGSKSFTSLSQTVNAGSTGYFYVTADIAGGATPGRTLSVNALTTASIIMASGTKSAGTLTAGGTQTIIAAPALSAGTVAGFGNQQVNTASSATSYTLSGANLTPASGNIVVTPPGNFEVSLDQSTWVANPSTMIVAYSGGALGATSVYVRFGPTAVQGYSGNITYSGGGVTSPPTTALSGAGVVAEPTLSASAVSSSQINLTIGLNAYGNSVVVVFNGTGTFTTPSGTPPAAGNAFAGGTVLVNGTSTSYNHTGLTPGQTCYYKAWSYVGTGFSAAGVTASAMAPYAPFTSGNLVIYRVGSGTGSEVNTGNPVFLDEYTPSGTRVQSMALPTAANGAQQPLVASGTASSEGLLTRSADGRYLILTGYGTAIPYGSSLASSASTSVPRVVGRVDAAGNMDTSTALTDAVSVGSPRSAASTDGTEFWIAGAAGGVRYASGLGDTTSSSVESSQPNVRQLKIFAGQLYLSSGAGTGDKGVNTVGTGLPTTSGQTVTQLPGFLDTTSPSAYGYFLADLSAAVVGLDTLYVADDGIGLTKYSFDGTTWTAKGTIGAAADKYVGLTATLSGTAVTLYATRKGGTGTTGGGELVSLTDSSGYNGTLSGTPTLLATAAANTAFRGVALAPWSSPPPTPTAGNNGPVCGGAALSLTASAISGANYAWTGPNGFSSHDQNPTIANATAAASGTYSVTATINDWASAPATTSVTVNAPATSAISGSEAVAIGQVGKVYSVTLTSGSSYAWTVPSGAAITAGATGPNNNQVTVTFGSTGGDVTVTETTGAGCVGEPVGLAVSVGPNHAPVAWDTTQSTLKDTAATFAKAKLLWGASDADNDTLTVTAAGPASAQGGTVTLQTSDVSYTPPAGFTGLDSYTFTLSDGNGGTALGLVSVTVTANGGTSPNIVVPPSYDSVSRVFKVTFSGIPGYTYTIEAAAQPTGPWSTLTTATAGADGLFEVTDSQSPPPPARYYRTVYP